MSLLTRSTTPELTWPSWFSDRSLFEWPGLPDLRHELDFKVEEFRDDDTFVVKAELAGVDPEKDLEITVDDHVMTIRAERRQEDKVEDTQGFRSEFRYGSFARSMRLPMGADESAITATYTDGILMVRVPMGAEAPATRTVTITRT